MTSNLAQVADAPELPDYDWWAIQVVVREGRYVNLSMPERIIAAKLMRRKGWGWGDIATALRSTKDAVTKLCDRSSAGLDIDYLVEVKPEIIGAPLPDTDPFLSRREVRRITGV